MVMSAEEGTPECGMVWYGMVWCGMLSLAGNMAVIHSSSLKKLAHSHQTKCVGLYALGTRPSLLDARPTITGAPFSAF
jgi:hypothetical protein